MKPERRAEIIADIETAECNGFLMGYVAGLRASSEMGDVDIVLAVRAKIEAEGWRFYVPDLHWIRKGKT